MGRKKLGEVTISANKKAEFFMTGFSIISSQAQNQDILYDDVLFLQEMYLEEKNEQKYILGLYLSTPNPKQTPSLTFGDFTNLNQFMEVMSAVRQSIANFEDELTGFYANLMVPRQKPKRYELGFTTTQILLRSHEDEDKRFFKIPLQNCEVEKNEKRVKISIHKCQVKTIYFDSKDDLQIFKMLFKNALEEKSREIIENFQGIKNLEEFKERVLTNDKVVLELYQKLVLSGIMSEENFWQNRPEYKNYQKYLLEQKQQQKKLRLPLLSKGYVLREEDKKQILDAYPQVKDALFALPKDKNVQYENQFWDEFVKLQIKYETEIIGGQTSIVVPNIIEAAEVLKSTPLGEVDLIRNLDLKDNVAENLRQESSQAPSDITEKRVQKTIKRLQTVGLNMIGGITPSSNLKGVTKDELIKEFQEVLPTDESRKESKPKEPKIFLSQSLKREKVEKMMIEIPHSQNMIGAGQNSQLVASKLLSLTDDNQLKMRRSELLNRDNMSNIFKILIQSANRKEEPIEHFHFRQIYENYFEKAKNLLQLFYSDLLQDQVDISTQTQNLKPLLLELINEINSEIGSIMDSMKDRKTEFLEAQKLQAAIVSIIEQLSHALKYCEGYN